MVANHFRDLLQVHGGLSDLLVHHHVLNLSEEARIVIAGEESRVNAECVRDAEQHGHSQRADVVLNLVDVTSREAQRLRERSLAEVALAA